MADVRPFRGVRYNLEKVDDAGKVVSPPYDVIDAAMQQALYDAHPANVVRIIQGKQDPDDTDTNNPYTRAAAFFQSWRDDGILIQDEESLYIYLQRFETETPEGRVQKQRIGVVGAVRIEPFGSGSILPHEHTMPGPKADRLELTRHTGAGFGQIFSLYSDPENRTKQLLAPVLEAPALFAFTDAQDIVHEFRQTSDPGIVKAFQGLLEGKPLFIADGHHRYETAVAYRDERLAEDGGDAADRPYGYNMQTLVNMDDAEGMAINPIHRVVTDLSDDDFDRLESGLSELFDTEDRPLTSVPELLKDLVARGKVRPVYGYCRDAKTVRYLTLKEGVDPASLDTGGHSDAWRGLSTGLLQLVLGRVLDLDEEQLTRGDKVRFVKSDGEVLTLLDEAPGRAGFFLNTVGMEQLREVVLAGERMPPKSTFFHPKVFSGLVMQDLKDW